MSNNASFTVYKASAGSGKTYTLVKEYLCIALSEPDNPYIFRHILAITFTNKAAAEMKERVIITLHSLSSDDTDHPMAQDLAGFLKINKQELARRARLCLSGILHHYSDFSIGTIDSFMHKVVKTFAFDLKIPINFQVEIDEEMLLNKAIQKVLGQVGNNKEITDALKQITLNKANEEKSLRIENDLYLLSKDLLKEAPAASIGKLKNLCFKDFNDLKNEIQKECISFVNKFKDLGIKALDLIDSAGLSQDDFYYGSRGVVSFFMNASGFSIGETIKINSYTLKALNDGLWYSDKTSNTIKNTIDSISDELGKYLEQLIDIHTNEYPKYILNQEILNTIDSVAMINEIGKAIDEIRNEEQTIHISEFNRRVSDVVINEPAPFVFERLGEKYRYFLIDEFQDTSILQWQNILPLIHNGLASNFSSIIVGDPKQAIYRFRGGEVEQFSKMPSPYPTEINPIQRERYHLLKYFHVEKNLDTNRRSLSEIVEFNNKFYEFINKRFLPAELQDVYKNHEQKHVLNKLGGSVGIKLLEFEKKIKKEEKNELIFTEIQSTINRLISNNKLNYREIAILTRDNRTGADLASYLIKNNIPVISGESLLVRFDPEVRMILAWMRVMSGYTISLYLFEIVMLLFEQKMTTFEKEGEFIQFFSENSDNIDFWIEYFKLPLQAEQLRLMPVTEFAYAICRAFGYSVQKNTYLQFFLEFIWHTAKNQSADIHVFLELWKDKSENLSITIPEDAEAVRIMTVHKSKGLQFPVVILNAFEPLNNRSEVKWLDDEALFPKGLNAFKFQLSEKMMQSKIAGHVTEARQKATLDKINLLYVATTRAEKALYIIAPFKEENEKKKKDDNIEVKTASWESMINDFINSNVLQFTKTENYYYSGFEEELIAPEKKKPLNTYAIEEYETAVWKNKISIAKSRSLSESLQSQNDQLSKGTLIHQFLSEINSAPEINNVVDKYLSEGKISKSEAIEISEIANNLMNTPEIEELLSNALEIFNETELLVDESKFIRPDKVFRLMNEIVVLDYKTGKPDKQNTHQVKQYINSLEKLYKLPCRGIIVYLSQHSQIEHVK